MKKNVSVRIGTALGGAALLALGLCAAAEGFFGVPVTAAVGSLLASGHVLAVLAKAALVALLAVMAVSSILCAMPQRKRRQDDFVMQKGENGAIGISLRAIEKQVRACIDKHDVIADAEISIREGRDGLIILLEVDQVAGVNIPLSVGLLQKQIRQYVSGCTGVDVQEVRVMVENNTTNVVASPFAVQDAVIPTARPAAEEPRVQPVAEPAPEAEPEKEAEPVQEAPAPQPAPAPAPVVIPEIPAMPETMAVEDERPLHQRVFGAEEQPVFVPAPPDLVVEQEIAAEEPEAADQPEPEEQELVIEAAVEEALPQEAAEAGAAYTEALWGEETLEAEASDEEEQEPQEFTI